MEIDIIELSIEVEVDFNAIRNALSLVLGLPEDQIGDQHSEYFLAEGINPALTLGLRVRHYQDNRFITYVDTFSQEICTEWDVLELAYFLSQKYECLVLLGRYFFAGDLMVIDEKGRIYDAFQGMEDPDMIVGTELLGTYQDLIKNAP